MSIPSATHAPSLIEDKKSILSKSDKDDSETFDLAMSVFLTQMKMGGNFMNPESNDPSKVTDFAMRLVGVKAATKQTAAVERLESLGQTILSIMASGLKGKQVEVPGNSFSVPTHTLDVQMPKGVKLAFIDVFNSEGTFVDRVQCDHQSLQAGQRRIEYDGKPLANGDYTYKLTTYVTGSDSPSTSEAQTLTVQNKPIHVALNMEASAPSGGDHPVPFLAVHNSRGILVQKILVKNHAGRQELDIEPLDITGSPLPSGQYTFRLIAQDEKGKAIQGNPSVLGTVDALNIQDGINLVRVYDNEVPLKNVLGSI